MLRLLVVLLLLANGAYFAWAHGHLLAWGLGPSQQAEPQRVDQQIRPEAVRVLKAEEARRAEAASSATRAAECLQAGPLEDALASTVKSQLESWPAGSWSLEPVVEPARWIVYMGKYPSAEQVDLKKAELRRLGIVFEPLSNSALEPGLSLGGFASEAEARRQMDALAQRGVRTARVMQERPELRGQKLVLAAVDETLRPRVEELRASLNGKLRPCR
jgi:hypothetical protein